MLNSLLDNDLYKFTQQQAVCQKFPHAQAQFSFINRGEHKFTKRMIDDIQDAVHSMKGLSLAAKEFYFLEKRCPFLNPVYRDFLAGYKYEPSEVMITFDKTKEDLILGVTGPWYRTILWEVPLMAIISEVYNKHTYPEYSYDGAKDIEKFKRLADNEVKFADFGTRRRLNYSNQRRIVTLASTASSFVGTSNVHFACENGLKPIGTHAHEWFMFHGAKYGYKEANHVALKHWTEVYKGNLCIALSDTYTTETFFKDFDSKYARLFDGVRHDSGDPIEFTDTVVTHYEVEGIDPRTKTIVFSDGLTVDKAIEIKDYCAGKIKCSFGIGTHFTNDIPSIKPMNMVIKMTNCKPYGVHNWQPTVKLSDISGKHTGEPGEIDLCKRTLGL